MAVDVRMPAGEARGGRRQSVPALILLSLFIVGALVLAACFAGWIAPYDYAAIDLRARLTPPAWYPKGSLAHLLGTDELGRDVLSLGDGLGAAVLPGGARQLDGGAHRVVGLG